MSKPTATYYCKECRKALCKECKEYHARRQETAQHNPQSLEEIRSESKTESYPGIQNRVTWKCHEHKDQDVQFYCSHHDVLICSHCAITEHKQVACEITMTTKAFEIKPTLKTDLTDQVAQTEKVHGKFMQAMTNIEEMRKTLQGSKDKARREIEERHQKMVEELARQKEELLHTTDEIFSRKENNLEEQLEELHSIKAVLRNPIDLTNDILRVGIQEEILYFRVMLQDHLKQLFAKYDLYNRDPRDNDIITFNDPCLDLTAAIGTVVGDPDIAEFTLEDPTLQDLHLIKGGEASFKIRSRDIVGSPLLEAPPEVIVEIQHNGEEAGENIRGAVEKENGFYKVTVTPQESGKHTLKIFVNLRDTQVHIKGSPFELNVIPPLTLEHECVIQSANLGSPWDITISTDKKQIVVTDVLQHCLVVFDENYAFVRVIGKQGDGELEFNSPRGVAFNPVNGQLVVVEKENNRVQILSAEFEFVSMFGERGGGEGMFCKPTCVAVNKDGQIFVTDTKNQKIQYFKSDGTPLGVIGGSIEGYGQALGKFNEPYAIVIDDQDELFVTEYSGSRVQVFHKVNDVTGYRSEFQFPSGDIRQPVGIVYDAENRYIFVSEQEKQRISIFSRTGQFFTSFGSMGNAQDQFQNPMGLAVLGDHRLMVADCLNKRLVVFKY